MFLGVYIHIPFCSSICSYCDFCKIYYNDRYISKYLDCLEDEIKNRYNGEVVNSIFIGGGTPTCLSYDELKRLLDIVSIFNVSDGYEFSIESNVESLSIDKIKLLKEYGVNRVSIGVQSFDNNIINILNRKHNSKMVFDTINNIKKCGIFNINIDIMYGIIDDVDVVKNDINMFLMLDIPHISCYSLILEDNTVLKNNGFTNISEDIESVQYNVIHDILSSNGYTQYEVSNYCKNGYQSVHNVNYWNNGNYYGFGLSSVSFLNNYRISNTRNMTKYLNGYYIMDKFFEDKDMQMSNSMILGLRKINGVNVFDFYKKFGERIEDVFDIDDLISGGKIVISDGYMKIDSKYLYLSNEILINFLERKML